MSLLLKQIIVLLSLSISLNCIAVDNLLSNNPINIEADKVEYIGEEPDGKIIASGNVVAVQDTQKISANFVEYDANKDILIASDKVQILEEQGYIIDANKVILSDHLRFGSINSFTVIMPDKSTLKGEYAKKNQEYLTDITEGYYTACQICPGKSPIWEITAKSATLDQSENSMTYYHPIFKLYGVPVLYTPYLSHYTSKAERRSGFLRPTYGMSTYLGQVIKVPYYLNLAPNYDAVIKPVITSERSPILEAEQRYLRANGFTNSAGSVTSGNEKQPKGHTSLDAGTRYHFFSEANFKLPHNNYLGWNSKFTSDKAYLKDYSYGSEDFLTNRVYNSAYQTRGYYEIQALTFQNLRPSSNPNTNDINQTPMVLPLFQSDHEIHQFEDNSSLNFSSNILNIHRYNGPETHRYSIKNKWNKSIITNNGNKFHIFASLRNDLYFYQDAPSNYTEQSPTRHFTRTIPETGIDWSYPMGRNFNHTKVIIEPLANALAVPYTKYNNKIYNEDSPSSELNDGNLFSESRYSGLDLVENTPRIGYGVKTSAFYQDQFSTSLLLGQLYRNKPYDYINNSKEDRFSDYVGRWKSDLMDRIIFSYQFTFDKYSFVNKTNEANVMLKYNKAFISTDILYYKNNQIVSGVKNRREFTLETGINDYNNISFSVNTRKNLSRKSDNPGISNGFVSTGSKIKYINDCITYSASVDKDLTKNADKKKNTVFWFDVSFKNIN